MCQYVYILHLCNINRKVIYCLCQSRRTAIGNRAKGIISICFGLAFLESLHLMHKIFAQNRSFKCFWLLPFLNGTVQNHEPQLVG